MLRYGALRYGTVYSGTYPTSYTTRHLRRLWSLRHVVPYFCSDLKMDTLLIFNTAFYIRVPELCNEMLKRVNNGIYLLVW